MISNSITESGTITGAWTVNAVTAAFPQTFGKFKELGVDNCCGGEARLNEAAAGAAISTDQLISELRVAIAGGQSADDQSCSGESCCMNGR